MLFAFRGLIESIDMLGNHKFAIDKTTSSEKKIEIVYSFNGIPYNM